MKTLYSLLFIIFLNTVSYASHIMGGNIEYKYIGDIGGGLYRYQVTFTVYSNCDSQANPVFQVAPPDSITYAVYQEGPDPSSDKPFLLEETIPLKSYTQFTPDIPNGCTASIDVCIFEAKYETTIDLPVSYNGVYSNGYHLYFDVCCRNDIINNLVEPGLTASVFYAFIPSPLIENNSPVFSDSPVPFLCVGETTPLLNTAFDPDGDQLVFSFQEPYKGYSSATRPQPGYSSVNGSGDIIFPDLYPNLNWPIPIVNWETGYSYTQPFTSSGSTTINGFTGYSEYTPSMLGNYVVAVEIKEYRNGYLIGITRRDMQMIVVNCPVNTPPNLSSSGSSGQTSYTIEEGANLCFDVIFNDANGDNIELSSNGDIFDPSAISPAATINTPKFGSGNVTANFCWYTDCNTGRDQPYLFTVNATDDGCLPKTTPDVYSIQVTNFEGPKTINGKINVCSNQKNVTYNVSASAGATYTWIVNGGSIVSGQGSSSISVNWGNGTIGEVIVQTTSQYGCSSDDISKLVNINQIPIDAGQDATICTGDIITLGGNPTSPAGFNYTWSPTTGLNNAGAANPLASPSVTTTYNLTVSDGSGCYATDQITINVKQGLFNVPNDTIICIGDTIQLSSSGGTTYIWTPNTNIDDNTSPNPYVFPSIPTNYIVETTASSGCKNKDTVFVDISTPITADAGNDQSVCVNDSLKIGGSPTGPANTHYQWFPSTYLDNDTLANPTSLPLANTTYFVTVTDDIGCFDIDTIEIQLFPEPIAVIGPDVSICLYDTLQLNASGGVSYTWSPNYAINDTTISDPLIFPSTDTTYKVVVTSSDGCSDTASINVTVNTLPEAYAGEDRWICPGDSTQLEATGGNSYLWSPITGLSNPNIYNPKADPGDTVSYIVTVTDINGCMDKDTIIVYSSLIVPTEAGNDTIVCIGDTAQLGGFPTAPSGTVYSWTPITGIDNPTYENPKVLVTNGSWYYCNTVNYTCNGIDSVFVDVYPLTNANAGNDVQICIGDSTQLSATGGISYTWNNELLLSDANISNPWTKPNDTTTFIVTVTDNNTCSNTDTVVVTVNPLPLIFAGNDSYTCKNISIVLGGTPTGPLNSTYSWQPNSGLNSDTIANPIVNIDTTTTYFLLVIDSNKCSSTDSVTINVFDIFTVNDTAICRGDSAKLMVTALSGLTPYTYIWTPDSGLSNNNTNIVYASPYNGLTYTVSVSDQNGCMEYLPINLTVNDVPDAAFVFSVIPHCSGLFATLTNNSVNSDNYKWTFDDIDTTSSVNPYYVFTYLKNHQVLLEAYNNFGCYDSTIYSLSVNDLKDYVTINPPIVITPNDDGINELFEIKGDFDLKGCTEISIFNRWGNMIFRSYGGKGWNGEDFSGGEVPEGVYFYVVDVNGLVFKGTVSVMR